MKKKLIQQIKVFIREKLFKVRNILIIIFLITILFLATHQKYLYEKGEFFKTEYTRIDNNTYQFAFLPDNPDFDLVCTHPGKKFITIMYHNLKTKALKQMDLVNYSINPSPYYYDNTEKSIYTIFTINGADYYLYELYNPKNPFEIKGFKIFHYNPYDSLQDTTIIINKTNFFQFTINNNLKENFMIEKFNDGYRLIFEPEFLYSIRRLSINEIETGDINLFVTKLPKL